MVDGDRRSHDGLTRYQSKETISCPTFNYISGLLTKKHTRNVKTADGNSILIIYTLEPI